MPHWDQPEAGPNKHLSLAAFVIFLAVVFSLIVVILLPQRPSWLMVGGRLVAFTIEHISRRRIHIEPSNRSSPCKAADCSHWHWLHARAVSSGLNRKSIDHLRRSIVDRRHLELSLSLSSLVLSRSEFRFSFFLSLCLSCCSWATDFMAHSLPIWLLLVSASWSEKQTHTHKRPKMARSRGPLVLARFTRPVRPGSALTKPIKFKNCHRI